MRNSFWPPHVLGGPAKKMFQTDAIISNIENHVLGGPERKLFGISSQTSTRCGPALYGLKIVDFQKA